MQLSVLKNVKQIIFTLFLFIITVLKGNAQIRPFIGGAVYLHSDFEKSSFGSFSLGSEFKIIKFLRPEIEISYMFGTPEDAVSLDDKGLTISTSTKFVSAINYSFCPKIVIGDYEEDSGYIQILPKYSFSRIEARRDLASRNPADLTNPIIVRQNASDTQHSLGIGVGYMLNFSGDYSNSLAFNLYYNGINLGKALNELKSNPNSSNYSTQDVLGFGINFYLGLKKKKV
ncbi:hypothetical protein OIU83_14795 [Flavobacterium sp. LS1R49]|uniref:Uncharacterized protein n=1 Tax=Flavobacterium shii TaxID=2987687 RepID=A0A9X2ZCN0_9FLAO|nr:hypothetical protein [Flavobacterium shii]MCV9928936.1 hypothetical protein [Flavobacterium shii]